MEWARVSGWDVAPVEPPRARHPRARPALLTWIHDLSRRVHPDRSFAGFVQRTLLSLQLLARHRALRRWHAAAVASPLHDMLAWRPSLVSVVRRPYVSSGWGASRRLGAVEDHYRQLTGPARALRLELGTALTLARVTARGRTLDILIDSPAWFIHEGELCLNLSCEGERIYTIAFSLGHDGGEPVAFVGALQGLGKDGALDLYRTLTTAFHGLRPRDLLIAAFRVVCRELGLVRWLAVDDRHRVSASPYFGPAMPVRSSYDAAWVEHGGSPRPDGFYRMPVDVARRSHEAMPSRKRSSYRHRYHLLDGLEAELARALRARAGPTRPWGTSS